MEVVVPEEVIACQPPEAQAIIRALLARSASGGRFVESMLAVIATYRPQRRNVFLFLTGAGEAHLAHQLPRSLLPGE